MLVVLVQNPKGGGLSSAFGGSGGGSQILGAKRTTDFLEKATWVLAVALIVLSLGSNFFINRGGDLNDNELTLEESISNRSEIMRSKVNTNNTVNLQEGVANPEGPK